jgi:transposase InsO family protein
MGLKDLAKGFITHIVQTHGLPNNIISDWGLLFTSKFWKQIMEAMGTTRDRSMVCYPETDSQMERTNAMLEQYL